MSRFETKLLQHMLSWCCFYDFSLRHVFKRKPREKVDIASFEYAAQPLCMLLSETKSPDFSTVQDFKLKHKSEKREKKVSLVSETLQEVQKIAELFSEKP